MWKSWLEPRSHPPFCDFTKLSEHFVDESLPFLCQVHETLPLDGMSLWRALVTGGASPRKDIYYGISQDNKGPAARDVEGYKLVIGGGGIVPLSICIYIYISYMLYVYMYAYI